MSIFNKIKKTRFWNSIFRLGGGAPKSQRDRMFIMLNNFFLHVKPVRVPKHAVKVKYTWCMGGVSFFIFLVLVMTGMLLMFYYRPSVDQAYLNVMDLSEQVPLGVLREIHRWSAHAMVITVWLHMFRVFMTGSYKPPREFNWVVGVVLLVLTMLLSFTGYLLPWDQIALWAITVGSNMAAASPFIGIAGPGTSLVKIGDLNLISATSDAKFGMLGGRFVGEAALLRFYVLHCVVLPFVIMIFIGVHFWRVRKDGGISGPL